MEVAALCLSAAMRMRPDPTWAPPIGVLFVRIMHAPWQNDITFGYADKVDPDGICHYRSVARIRDWHAEADFGGSVDFAKGDMDHAGSGAAIVRRLATENDVAALRKLWSDRFPFAEWLEDALSREGLCEESKALLRRGAET